MKHGFSTFISISETLLRFLKLLPISRSRLIFSKILFFQSWLHSCRNACDLRYMLCSISRTYQRRIKNLINMNLLLQNILTKILRLLMSFFGKLNICRTTDLILYISYSLSMSRKIKISHRISFPFLSDLLH